MKRVVLIGLALTVVIFLPRLLGHRPWDAAVRLWGDMTRGLAGTSPPSPAPSGPTLADRVAELEARVDQLQSALAEERTVRSGAVDSLSRRGRSLAGLVATDRLRRRVDEGLFKVPAWQAPPASKLTTGDLPRYLKVGVGLVETSGDDVPADLGPLLVEVTLFFLTESKVKSVRLYRETLSPPSPNLDLSVRLRCTLNAAGGLDLNVSLVQVKDGAVVWEGAASGDDYVGAVREVVAAAVGTGLAGRVGGGGD